MCLISPCKWKSSVLMDFSSLRRALRYGVSALYRRSITLSGTSILETVISLTILLTILTLTFASVDRVNASLNPQAVYKAHLATNSVMAQENLLVEENLEYMFEGYRITKHLISLDSQSTHLILEVYNGSGKLLYTRHMILVYGISI